ncbi:unnamed protein product, partial [marine sediment metagenome]
DIGILIKYLECCGDFDYFEKSIEMAVADGLRVFPVDVSDLSCTEIDFPEDLQQANRLLITAGKLDD